MEATVESEFLLIIKLNEEEARWLKGVMQESFKNTESLTDREMRNLFWNTLDDALD